MSEEEILVFGATSLVGSHFVASVHGNVTSAGRTPPDQIGLSVKAFRAVAIDDLPAVERIIRQSSETIIINFAARTDVDDVERERPPDGTHREDGDAWRVNALAPEAMAKATRATGKYFIHLSTDFVFDGRSGPYGESALRPGLSHAMSWYGWTKGEGERRLLEADPSATVIRIAYPFRSLYPRKLDLARWLIQRQRQGTLPPLYSDQRITPTWVPDVSAAIRRLCEDKPSGFIHLASSEPTTPFDFAQTLFQAAGLPHDSLTEGHLASQPRIPGRAPRPLSGGLRSDRLPSLHISTTPWREAVGELVREERWR